MILATAGTDIVNLVVLNQFKFSCRKEKKFHQTIFLHNERVQSEKQKVVFLAVPDLSAIAPLPSYLP
jgi:hypothetical protein